MATIEGLAVAPDRTIYLLEQCYGSNQTMVRSISPPRGLVSDGRIVIPAESGREAYIFDTAGRHLFTVDTRTGVTLFAFDYDGAGRLRTVTDRVGLTTTIERFADGRAKALADPYGRRTTLSQNGAGFLETVANPAGDTFRMTYFADGLLDSFTVPNGGVARSQYDADGRLTLHTDAAGVSAAFQRMEGNIALAVARTTSLGRTTLYNAEWLADGRYRRTATDSSGAVTTVTMNVDGTSQTDYPDGSRVTQELQSDPRYTMQAPVLKEAVVRLPSNLASVATANRTVTLADPGDTLTLERLTDTLLYGDRVVEHTYLAAARQNVIITPGRYYLVEDFDEQGRPTRQTQGSEEVLDPKVFTYGDDGRLTRIDRGSWNRQYAYDAYGRLAEVLDGASRQFAYGYDDADRLTEVGLPSGRTYRFEYDRNGNRTRIVAPSGAVHGFQYTPSNRFAAYTTPSGHTYSAFYDEDGAVQSLLLPSGRATTFVYNAAGAAESIVYPEATVTLAYAGLGSCCGAGALTRTPATGTAQTITTAHDGFLVSELVFSGAANGRYNYGYDDTFEVTGVSLDGGATNAIARDPDGNITTYGPFTVTRGGPLGRPSRLTDGTAVVVYNYDRLARLRGRSCSFDGHAVHSYGVTYDEAGFVTEYSETRSGATAIHSYNYDPDGQLLTASLDGALRETYQYDFNGNRVSRRIGAGDAEVAVYDSEDRMVSQGGLICDVNDDGWLVRRGTDTFQYSARGELLSANAGGHTVGYAYDGLGRRTARTEGAGTYQYLYGNPADTFLLSAVRAPDGTLIEFYYDDFAFLYALQRGGSWYYVAVDPVGTPLVICDAAGTLVKSLTYDAYGNRLSDSNPAFELPVGFAGGLDDRVTGLVRFGFRDYDPASGRWTSRDPLLTGSGAGNFYAYARNNPVCWRDPSGLFCITGQGYAGVGGGNRLCITREGVSACRMLGFGVGGGLDVDIFGDLDRDGEYIEAEAKLRGGPFELGFGGRFNECGLEGGPRCTVGPFNLCSSQTEYSHDPEHMERFRELARGMLRFGASARLNATMCNQLRW